VGNRSKYVAMTAATGAVIVAARRRARLRRALEQAVVGLDTPPERSPGDDRGTDKAHAPGHRHLPTESEAPTVPRFRRIPWSRGAYRRWEAYKPR
jgi:hypothetical protein